MWNNGLNLGVSAALSTSCNFFLPKLFKLDSVENAHQLADSWNYNANNAAWLINYSYALGNTIAFVSSNLCYIIPTFLIDRYLPNWQISTTKNASLSAIVSMVSLGLKHLYYTTSAFEHKDINNTQQNNAFILTRHLLNNYKNNKSDDEIAEKIIDVINVCKNDLSAIIIIAKDVKFDHEQAKINILTRMELANCNSDEAKRLLEKLPSAYISYLANVKSTSGDKAQQKDAFIVIKHLLDKHRDIKSEDEIMQEIINIIDICKNDLPAIISIANNVEFNRKETKSNILTRIELAECKADEVTRPLEKLSSAVVSDLTQLLSEGVLSIAQVKKILDRALPASKSSMANIFKIAAQSTDFFKELKLDEASEDQLFDFIISVEINNKEITFALEENMKALFKAVGNLFRFLSTAEEREAYKDYFNNIRENDLIFITKLTEWVKNSELNKADQKQLFVFVLAMKDKNKLINFNNEGNMDALLKILDQISKVTSNAEEREAYKEYFNNMDSKSLSLNNQLAEWLDEKKMDITEKKQFVDAFLKIENSLLLPFDNNQFKELHNTFAMLAYDASAIELLADYMKLKGGTSGELPLQNLGFASGQFAENKHKLIKEIINLLAPIDQKLAEFCAFYVPFNLSNANEKMFKAFINRDNQYSESGHGIKELNLGKAITYKNPTMLKDLQQFFIAENKPNFNNSIAGYLAKVMKELFDFSVIKNSEFVKEQQKLGEKQAQDYLALSREHAKDNSSKLYTLHEDKQFEYPLSIIEARIDTLPHYLHLLEFAKNFSNLVNNDNPADIMAAYDNFADFIIPNQFLEEISSLISQYYDFIFAEARNFGNEKLVRMVKEYYTDKFKKDAIAIWDKFDVNPGKDLEVNFWLAMIMVNKAQYVQQYINQISKIPMVNKLLENQYQSDKNEEKANFYRNKLLNDPTINKTQINAITDFSHMFFMHEQLHYEQMPSRFLNVFDKHANFHRQYHPEYLPEKIDNQQAFARFTEMSSLYGANIPFMQALQYRIDAAKVLKNIAHGTTNGSKELKIKAHGDFINSVEELAALFLVLENLENIGNIFTVNICNFTQSEMSDFFCSNAKFMLNFSQYKFDLAKRHVNSLILNGEDNPIYPENEQLAALKKIDDSWKGIKLAYHNTKIPLPYQDILYQRSAHYLITKSDEIKLKQNLNMDYQQDCQIYLDAIQINGNNESFLQQYKQLCTTETVDAPNFSFEEEIAAQFDEL